MLQHNLTLIWASTAIPALAQNVADVPQGTFVATQKSTRPVHQPAPARCCPVLIHLRQVVWGGFWRWGIFRRGWVEWSKGSGLGGEVGLAVVAHNTSKPLLWPGSPIWVSCICASYIAGADPRSPLGWMGLYNPYPETSCLLLNCTGWITGHVHCSLRLAAQYITLK